MLTGDLLRLSALLASGALAAGATAWFLSGRVPSVSQSAATELSLYLTLYALLFTGTKLGTDGLILSKGDQCGSGTPLGLRRFMKWWALPVIVISGAVMAWKFGWQVLVPSMIALRFDLRSVTIAAALTGAGDTAAQSIGTLLNFPSFFLGLYCVSLFSAPDLATMTTLFAVSSMVRYAYISRRGVFPDGPQDVLPGMLAMLGLQQCLNYLLFRADQILLSLTRNIPVLETASPARLADYLVHSKGYEAVCAVTMLACMVVRPHSSTKDSAKTANTFGGMRTTDWLERALIMTTIVVLLHGWFNQPTAFLLPFAAGAVLSLAVNRRTLEALSRDNVVRLVIALGASLALGLVCLTLFPKPIELHRLAYLVPLQMLVFLSLFRVR